MEKQHPAAILIHAYGCFDKFQEFLKRFSQLSGVELVAVLGPREDFERAAKAHPPGVTLLFQDCFWKSRALQMALQHTAAGILLLTDIDCLVTQDWLDRLLQPIREEGEDVVTGPSLPAPGTHPFLAYQKSHDLALIGKRGHYVDGIFGRNTAFRRDALLNAGGFSTEIRTGDDYSLGTKLINSGYRIRFINNPIESSYETSAWSYLKQQSRWLRNILYIGAMHKRDAELKAARRTVAVSFLLLASTLASFYQVWLGVPALTIFLGGLWRREQRLFQMGTHWKAALLIPWYQILDHLARILAFLRYAIPPLRNRW